MLNVPDLNFGTIDAGNYSNRSEKEFCPGCSIRIIFWQMS
jgi:hypothetical protein